MSRIDDMLREMCPDGVEFVPLGGLGTWSGGGTPSKDRAEYWESGEIPWVTPKDMGAHVLAGSQVRITAEAVASSNARLIGGPSIAVVARSSILEKVLPVSLVPFPSTFNQDMKVLTPSESCDPKFVLYSIRSHEKAIRAFAMKSGGSVASLISSRFFECQIGLPPIEIQREIVKVLGTFAELEAELEARKMQYAHYRDFLLSFDNARKGGGLGFSTSRSSRFNGCQCLKLEHCVVAGGSHWRIGPLKESQRFTTARSTRRTEPLREMR